MLFDSRLKVGAQDISVIFLGTVEQVSPPVVKGLLNTLSFLNEVGYFRHCRFVHAKQRNEEGTTNNSWEYEIHSQRMIIEWQGPRGVLNVPFPTLVLEFAFRGFLTLTPLPR